VKFLDRIREISEEKKIEQQAAEKKEEERRKIKARLKVDQDVLLQIEWAAKQGRKSVGYLVGENWVIYDFITKHNKKIAKEMCGYLEEKGFKVEIQIENRRVPKSRVVNPRGYSNKAWEDVWNTTVCLKQVWIEISW